MIKSAQFNNLSAVRLLSLLVVLGALLLVVPGQGHAASDKEDPTAQLSRLQSTLFSYADKYMSAIVQVALMVQKRDPTNSELRLRMHSLKLVVTSTVQGLAVSPNPESTLLDMMVYATLNRILVEEDWSREIYGDAVESMIPAMQVLEKEIWDIARGYLTETEIAEVRKLIHTWKLENPDLKVVSFIRFSDFASMRSKSPLVEKVRKSGFLVDTSDAVKAADQALLLSERVLHYSQRLPYIIEWQVERVFYQLAVEPEFRQSLEQSQGITQSLNRFADSMEKLPQQIVAERQASIEQMASAIATERSAAIRELTHALAEERHGAIEEVRQSVSMERVVLFKELDARQSMLSETVGEARAGLADADKLAIDLEKTTIAINEVLLNADKLMARFDSGFEGDESVSEPFDINSYVDAIKELTITIQEANTLLLSTERLTSGENTMSGVFDRVLWTGTILILILCVAVFITMLTYRAVARRIIPRSSFEYVGPPPTDRQDR